MFENAKPNIEQILELVAICPEKLQEKCFELFLTAYLEQERPPQTPQTIIPVRDAGGSAGVIPAAPQASGVPEQIKTRFLALAQRAKASPESAAALFDFNLDPFNYHALAIPGSSNREKMKNVALMLALKSYLSTTNWQADWKEFRAMCLDHGCWDASNAGAYLKTELFRSASSAGGISLSPAGVKAAETLFAKLAGASTEDA